MASFTQEFLDDDVSGGVAWKKITDYLKNGAQSVEVLSRTIDGDDKWELRVWDGIRTDRSNSAKPPGSDF